LSVEDPQKLHLRDVEPKKTKSGFDDIEVVASQRMLVRCPDARNAITSSNVITREP
jgi:hypothetical protein